MYILKTYQWLFCRVKLSTGQIIIYIYILKIFNTNILCSPSPPKQPKLELIGCLMIMTKEFVVDLLKPV